jgi:hypothetical protein
MTESNLQSRRLRYARANTYGQTFDAQSEQLRADGCARICSTMNVPDYGVTFYPMTVLDGENRLSLSVELRGGQLV